MKGPKKISSYLLTFQANNCVLSPVWEYKTDHVLYPYIVWRQESKVHKIIWKTSRYFSSHLVLIFILQRAHLCWERQRAAAQQQGNLQSPLNSFIIVSTPDHHLSITLWQLWTLIDLDMPDMTWLLHEGIFHVGGLCDPSIFGSSPWGYVMCNWAHILICWRHWPRE